MAVIGVGERVETQTKRILVVDDFAAWRNLIKTILSITPEWQIAGEAATGAEAIAVAQHWSPDLVLLDIDLPDLNGIEVARRLQALAPNTKIVFLTAEPALEIANAALSTGALGYLLKSDVINELLPALHCVFSGERFVSKNMRK